MNTETFLRYWFHGCQNSYIELTFIAPPDVNLYPKTVVRWAGLAYGDAKPAMLDYIHAMNEKGYGCYFGVTPSAIAPPPEEKPSKRGGTYTAYRRRKEADVPAITGLWLDLDTHEPEKALHGLLGHEIKPTIVTSTGGGLHAYYRFQYALQIYRNDTLKDRIKNTLKGMVKGFETYGADRQAVDLARVLRIPETVNTKPNRGGAKCEVIYKNSQHLTSLDALEIAFYHLIPRPLPKIERKLEMRDRDLNDLPRMVTDYIANGANQGERNRMLYICARFFNDAGKSESEAEQILGTRAGMDGLDGEEINRTIASAYRAPRSALLNSVHQQRLSIQDQRIKHDSGS